MNDQTTPNLPPEPVNGTALYWPEDDETFSALVVRDDLTAEVLDRGDRRWFVPNDWSDSSSWAEVVNAAVKDGGIECAVVLRRPQDPED